MENWLDQDEIDTIKTFSFPLTFAQGSSLYNKIENINPLYPKPHSNTFEFTKEENEKNYSEIIEKLNQMIDLVDGKNRGCFVKLSCRSAKDFALASDKTKKIFYELLDQYKKDNNINTKIDR